MAWSRYTRYWHSKRRVLYRWTSRTKACKEEFSLNNFSMWYENRRGALGLFIAQLYAALYDLLVTSHTTRLRKSVWRVVLLELNSTFQFESIYFFVLGASRLRFMAVLGAKLRKNKIQIGRTHFMGPPICNLRYKTISELPLIAPWRRRIYCQSTWIRHALYLVKWKITPTYPYKISLKGSFKLLSFKYINVLLSSIGKQFFFNKHPSIVGF